MVWTQFHDMHSGGGQKLEWGQIFIEAPEAEAKVIFYNRFKRNPERVTCTCCGEDYSISEEPTLARATAYERGCRALKTPRVNGRYKKPDDPWFDEHYYLEEGEEPKPPYEVEDGPLSKFRKPYLTVEQYIKSPGVLAIPASEIRDEWRSGYVPREGYVWAGDDDS